MLQALVRFSLHFKGIVIILSCLLIGYGMYTLSQSKYDVFPEFAPPEVDIQTEAPGLAPEQVEILVTQLIENAVNGVPGIESIRSSSIQGLSLIKITFSPGSNIDYDRRVLAERLSTVISQLPQGIEAPIMVPLTSSTGDLMTIGLTSDKLSLMELRTLADWIVKQRLQAVPGIAKIGTYGGERKQIQIQILPDKLIHYNLALEEVLAAARRTTGVLGAGFVDTGNQRITLRSEGQPLTPDQIAHTVVAHGETMNIFLGDIANITYAPEPAISAGSVMGKPGVVMNLWSQYGTNTLEVTKRVDLALAELDPALKKMGVKMDSTLFRAANFIETAVNNVESSLLLGGILVIVVLFLFLLNFRTAAISCTAIPLSILTAIIVLREMGISLNTMTLGGLAIAMGEVVDDAVIDVENILRRLRENRTKENPISPFKVVLNASLEVRSAVVYATFAVVLVFLPVLTMTGLAGRFFAPLGFAYILAVLASLLVALTLTPALCLLLLGNRDISEKESRFNLALKRKYSSILSGIERNSKTVIFFVTLITLLGMSTIFFFGGQFLPEFQEGHFIVHTTSVPGTSIEETLRMGTQITNTLLKLPFVRSVAQRVGRAEADDVFGPNSSELEVDLKPLKSYELEQSSDKIRETLKQFPGMSFAVNTFFTERIEETLSGYVAAVVINIYGTDLDALDAKAKDVAKVLGNIHGAADVNVESPPGSPQFVVRLRKQDLARWGFTPIDVLEEIRTFYEGEKVGQVYEGNRILDVNVILNPQQRKNIGKIKSLPMKNSGGTYVHLGQLADIYETSGRYNILHDSAQRVQTITSNVTGRDVNSFVEEAKKKIQSTVTLPNGSYVDFTGAAQAQNQSKRDLMIHSIIAGIGIILLLSVVMGNYRNLLLVLVNLPFALVGGILAVFAQGGNLSIGSLVGFVTLFGITLRNSIMMISHYDGLVNDENMPWGIEAAIRGASQRLTPILMTALVTAFGLLPLAIGTGDPGREIEGPMAVVILGGLVTSTALNLLVLPTLALKFGNFTRKVD